MLKEASDSEEDSSWRDPYEMEEQKKKGVSASPRRPAVDPPAPMYGQNAAAAAAALPPNSVQRDHSGPFVDSFGRARGKGGGQKKSSPETISPGAVHISRRVSPPGPGAYHASFDLQDDDEEETARPSIVDDDANIASNEANAPVADVASTGTPLVSAHTVEESPIVEAKKDNLFQFIKHNRKAQVAVALLVAVIVALAVGLGAALSPPSSSEEPEFFTVDGTLNGSTRQGEFGSTVAMSGNGNRIAVGAPGMADSTLHRSLVHVFERNNTKEWVDIGSVDLGESYEATMGVVRAPLAISLSRNGKTLAIGSPFQQGPSGTSVGRVDLYNWNDSNNWQTLGNPIFGEAADALFGASVDLSDDGGIVVVGVPGASDDQVGNKTGQVNVFQLNKGNWTMRGSPVVGSVPGAMFGSSVSLSSDGKMLAAGASTTANGGDVVVRTFEFFGDWDEQGAGIVGREGISRNTAYLAKLSADGSIMVISNYYIGEGSDESESNESLDVRAFQYNGGTWTQLGEPLHYNEPGVKSGYIVSLSEDGLTIGMGDPGTRREDGGVKSGHAHIYHYENDEWKQVGPDIEGMNPGDEFGFSVAMSGNGQRFVAGAPHSRESGPDHGRVQVFEWEA